MLRCLVTMAGLLVMPFGVAYGQSLSGRGNTGGMAMGHMQVDMATMANDLAATQQQIQAMQLCAARHGFYAPGTAGADASGCLYEKDPKVATPVANNSLCTSDGAHVTCLSIDPSMVFKRTYVSTDTGPVRTARVYCPQTALRIGCSGTRGWLSGGMNSTCANADCGLLGVMPLDDANGHGCEAVAKTTTEEPAVVATCFNPNGGTDQTSGGTGFVALAPCSLPWGGSINSGQVAQAYQASQVPAGTTCQKQARTCTNGSLSGNYTSKTCTVQSGDCKAGLVSWSGGKAYCGRTSSVRTGWNMDCFTPAVCSGSVPAGKNGDTHSVSVRQSENGGPVGGMRSDYKTGDATFKCVNGDWVVDTDDASASCFFHACQYGNGVKC